MLALLPAPAAQSQLAAPFLWNGVRLVPHAPATLEFSPLKGAQSYRVLLSASESLHPVLAETVVDAPEVRITALADGDYFVRVRGIDDIGLEGRDTVARLRVRARADPPRPEPLPMNAPALEDETLALSVPGRPGQRFEWQLAADTGFVHVVVEQRTEEPAVLLPRPAPGTYYARVRATDADGALGPYTPARVILVPAKAPKPNCLIEGPAGVCAAFGPVQR